MINDQCPIYLMMMIGQWRGKIFTMIQLGKSSDGRHGILIPIKPFKTVPAWSKSTPYQSVKPLPMLHHTYIVILFLINSITRVFFFFFPTLTSSPEILLSVSSSFEHRNETHHRVICVKPSDFDDHTDPHTPCALLKACVVYTGIVDPPKQSTRTLKEMLEATFDDGLDTPGIELHAWSSLPQGTGALRRGEVC